MRSRLATVAVVVGLAVACSDGFTPLGPPTPESSTSSIEVTTVTIGDGAASRGLKLIAGVTLDEASSKPHISNLQYFSLSDAERNDLAASVMHRRTTTPSFQPNVLPPPGALNTRGPLLRQTSVSFKDQAGNSIREVTVRVNTAKGYGPPGASVLFRNDTLQTITEFLRDSEDSSISGLRVTRFGSDGWASGVSVIRSTLGSGSSSRLGLFLNRLTESCGGILRTLGPTPVHAQASGEECVDEAMTMAFAASAYGLAIGAAVLACAAPGPPCVVALGYLASAGAFLLWKTQQYDDCMEENNPNPVPIDLSGDYISTTASGCLLIDWYVSYDGGVSWHYLGTETLC